MSTLKIIFLSLFISLSGTMVHAVDVLIVTDEGGHSSAAIQVAHLYEKAGISYAIVYQAKFSNETDLHAGHERHLKRFEETPELINASRDEYYAQADKATALHDLLVGRNFFLDNVVKILNTEKPKLIVQTTENLDIFEKLKEEGYTTDLPLAWIPTDYGREQLWTRVYANAANLIFSPAKQWTQAAIQNGVPAKKIFDTGMPVHPNALRTASPEEIESLWKPLGFNHGTPTVLIAGGSAGLGGYKQILDSIAASFKDQPVQIIAATGSHQRNFDLVTEYAKTTPKNISIVPLGFTDKLPQYMRYVADIIVTKAGGLTSTEVALMGKPMVHTIPAVNTERDNIFHFGETEMAVTSTWADMGKTLLKLVNSKTLQASLVANQRRNMQSYNLDIIVEQTKAVIAHQKATGTTPSYSMLSRAAAAECGEKLGAAAQP